MDNSIKTIYRELEDRYVKICWTHKIQEVQAGLYLTKVSQVTLSTSHRLK